MTDLVFLFLLTAVLGYSMHNLILGGGLESAIARFFQAKLLRK